MTTITITVESEIDFPGGTNKTKFICARNSVGDDISNEFLTYCSTNSLPMNTQDDLISATNKFTEQFNNTNLLP